MTILRFDIPVDKIPALATAAILAGQDLGSWAAGETRDRLMEHPQEIPGEAGAGAFAQKQAPVAGSAYDAPCLLPTSLPEPELSPADEDPTLNEIFADCL